MYSRFFLELFEQEPEQWGLRGDPYFWHVLRSVLLHEDTPVNMAQLEAQLQAAFLKILGKRLSELGDELIDWLPKGGMSGRHICGNYWRETGVPFLLERGQMLLSRSPI